MSGTCWLYPSRPMTLSIIHHEQHIPVSCWRLLFKVLDVHLEAFPRSQEPSRHHGQSLTARLFLHLHPRPNYRHSFYPDISPPESLGGVSLDWRRYLCLLHAAELLRSPLRSSLLCFSRLRSRLRSQNVNLRCINESISCCRSVHPGYVRVMCFSFIRCSARWTPGISFLRFIAINRLFFGLSVHLDYSRVFSLLAVY